MCSIDVTSAAWDFITSPGFGGAAALIAAGVAALVGYSQHRANRDRTDHERWWSTLTWVYDRTVVDNKGRAPLAQSVTVGVLKQLNDQVKRHERGRRGRSWTTEAEAVASLADMFGDDSAVTAGAVQPASGVLGSLQADLEERGYGHRARAGAYRASALEAVTRVLPDAEIDSPADIGINIDEVMVRQGEKVATVRFAYHETPTRDEGTLYAEDTRLLQERITEKYGHPVIVVSNQPLPEEAQIALADTPLFKYVHWTNGIEDLRLTNAIREFGFQVKSA